MKNKHILLIAVIGLFISLGNAEAFWFFSGKDANKDSERSSQTRSSASTQAKKVAASPKPALTNLANPTRRSSLQGQIVNQASGEQIIAKDKSRNDGKNDYWIHLKNGKVFKKEWDRNFDGKPDFYILESDGHMTEKGYDDNFDGNFDRIEKAPAKGSSGIAKTSPWVDPA